MRVCSVYTFLTVVGRFSLLLSVAVAVVVGVVVVVGHLFVCLLVLL